MNQLSKIKAEYVISLLFFVSIIFISYKLWLFTVIGLSSVLLIYLKKENARFLSSILLAFLISFSLFQILDSVIDKLAITKEIHILLNRSLLLLIVVSLVAALRFGKQDVSIFLQKPKWRDRVILPFHTVSVLNFWLTGIFTTVLVFSPFIFRQEIEEIKSLLLFALFFSLINAVCEEVIWRGLLLSSLQKYVSHHLALIITSIGFGLLHLAIGMPMIVSLSFSFAGLYYALLVLESRSIYPAIIHHYVINMGMVLSGWIV